MRYLKYGLIIGCLLAVTGYVLAQVGVSPTDTQPGTFVLAMITPDKKLPQCLETVDDKCITEIHRLIREHQTGKVTIFTAYLRKNKKLSFAQLYRLPYKTDKWLWAIESQSLLWDKTLSTWGKTVAGVVGPFPLAEVAKKESACPEVSEKLLVKISNDGGLVQPRPYYTEKCQVVHRDAGVDASWIKCERILHTPKYPDAGVYGSCVAGKGPFYLLQLRYNGARVKAWDPAKVKEAEVVAKELPASFDEQQWEEPAVPTTKTCTVPIDFVCPIIPVEKERIVR